MQRIRIMGTTTESFDQPCFLERLDPDFDGGIGLAVTTGDPGRAMLFETAALAWACWREQSHVRPLRPDGKPNRPLTAYTIMIESVPPREEKEKNDLISPI